MIKLDHQDDGAAYRLFCSENLQNCYINLNKANQIVSHFTNNNNLTVYYIQPHEK